ncbi:Hypothetical predicted protein [Cloeon dipterum]|uniref:Tudor domain-containing protein n=1 Tax=Cloeon dipterum TaxID=197152 RepID=A0A8S1DMK0_9INSE|nr:Hypothetical predicted protein [Cloeon dipterum]
MPDNISFSESNKSFFNRQLSQTSQVSESLSTNSERKAISQKSKKKPDPIDVALENEGLCRKLMPRDGNTIFRAVSDQLYGTQAYQNEVKEIMLLYFYEKHEELQQIITNYQSCNTFIDYITHKMVCAVECCFRTGVHLFDETGNAIYYESASAKIEPKKKVIKLAVDRQLCWDSVYPIDYFKVQGICQSLLYEGLYENVFNLKNVFFAVETMLGKPKKNLQQASKMSPNKETMLSLLTNKFKDSDLTLDLKVLIDMGIPPFPYKVAKSLSPYVYRNTEYDVCAAIKGSNSENISKNFLFEGCKCIIHKRSNYRYYGYVQRLFPELGKAVVFVEQLGELCEISIELIEPVIATKKPSRRRKGKFSRRYSSMDRDDHISDVDAELDDVFEEDSHELMCEEKSNKKQKFVDVIEAAAEITGGAAVSHLCEVPVIPNESVTDEICKDEVSVSSDCGVDGVTNYLLTVYGPYNQSAVPGYPGLINKAAMQSFEYDGSDLNLCDISTLRFFYNLGQRHYQAAMCNTFLEQNLVCLAVVETPPGYPSSSSSYCTHLSAPCTVNGVKYPLCVYTGEVMVGAVAHHDQVPGINMPTDPSKPKAAGSIPDTESIEKSFEDILNACLLHYFGRYFAHYPRAFPFPVNLCCQPSMFEDGSDLPYDDVLSLRYYYNLGIRNHQAAELTFLHQKGSLTLDTLFSIDEASDENKHVCATYNMYRSALERQFVNVIFESIGQKPV